MVPINRKKLLAAHAQLIAQNVKYGYGAKAEGGRDPRNNHRWNPKSTGKLSTPISTIRNIDCSGLIRYEAYVATGGALVLPDGSQVQLNYFRDRHNTYPSCPYRDMVEAKDNVLRVAFMSPGKFGVGSIGHVWWGFNTNTLESYGGHGVGSHKASVYSGRTTGCYVVPSISGTSTSDSLPEKPNPKLVIVTNGNDRHLIESSKLEDNAFTALDTEIMEAFVSGKRVNVRKFLADLGIEAYEEKDKISSDARYELYI